MSYDLNVYLQRSAMPSPSAWKKAIVDAQFSVELDDDFDVDSFTGFLPAPARGTESGFEYYSSALTAEDIAELELAPGLDFSVQFSIGSAPMELVSALAAASVLAAVSGGWLYDPQDDHTVAPGDAIDWAKAQLAQVAQ